MPVGSEVAAPVFPVYVSGWVTTPGVVQVGARETATLVR
jgi:hypothetical protein